VPDNTRTGVQRILMTADVAGEVWTYVSELAGALARHDIQILIATMGGPLQPAHRASLGDLRAVEIVESEFKLEWMDDPWHDVILAAGWLLELEREFVPDVVHLNGYVHAALPWRAPRLVVGHSCVCSWFEALRGRTAPPAWRPYAERVRRGLRAADAVSAPTQHMLDTLYRLYGPFARHAPIYNGRSSRLFRTGPKEPFILTAGRLWDEARNTAALDRAAADLDWPVFAAGPPAASGRRDDECRHLKLLGTLDEPTRADWYRRAAIFALPARYEPFGIAALEAALSGCALVLGDVPSLREVWGDAASFVAPDDPRQLQQTLRQLTSDDRLRERMACRAYQRAQRYTPPRMATGYLKLYGTLLNKCARGIEPAPSTGADVASSKRCCVEHAQEGARR
jgi:glycosyltransferase involved in cell wall biosynthesis